MPTVVADALAAHLAVYRVRRAGLVFVNSYTNPLCRSAFAEMWHRATASAGLPASATFHDLRHFYASLLIARGCSIKTVQRRLGHQSAMETLDTYGHLWPDSEDETRDAVDFILGGIRAAGDPLRAGPQAQALGPTRSLPSCQDAIVEPCDPVVDLRPSTCHSEVS